MRTKLVSERKPFQYIIMLVMLYVTLDITGVLLVSKQVAIAQGLVAVASIPILPLTYFLSDIIAEVYGYKYSRQVIWMGVFSELIFAILCYELIKLPSPAFWHYDSAYTIVLGCLPRVFLAGSLGRLCGMFLNVYCISKWKILFHGKYFWARSLGSTTIGEGIFTVISVLVIFSGKTTFSHMLSIMGFAYLYKLVFSPIAVVPSAYIANVLKRKEGVDYYDLNTNFNPFKLSLRN